jgi:hypothetical protein
MTVLCVEVTKCYEVLAGSHKRDDEIGSLFELIGHHAEGTTVLAYIQKEICPKHPEMWAAKDLMLLHDSALKYWLQFTEQELETQDSVVFPPTVVSQHCAVIFTSFHRLAEELLLQECSIGSSGCEIVLYRVALSGFHNCVATNKKCLEGILCLICLGATRFKI